MQVRAETPEERAAGESLLATIRTAAAPGLWRPPGAAAPPMAAAPPVTPPSPAPAAAYRPAPLAAPAVPSPAPPQHGAAALWASVVADINVSSGFNADGTPRTVGAQIPFVEPRAGRNAGSVWDDVAAKLNAEVRAKASAEAPSAAAKPADLWGDVAASINAEGRAASSGFITPGARGAHAESFR